MIAKVTFEIDLGGLIDTSIEQYQEQAHDQVVNLLFQSAITKYLMSSMRNISHPTSNAHADAMFQVDCDNNVCITSSKHVKPYRSKWLTLSQTPRIF